MDKVMIYTDGACKGNPGPGGWATILECRGVEKVLSGGKPRTTNNHMELSAVIFGLKALNKPCIVEIVTDSKYVADSFNKGWFINWIKKNDTKRPNYELWLELYKLKDIHNITMTWIKGHAGHSYNERCDEIAQKEALRFM